MIDIVYERDDFCVIRKCALFATGFNVYKKTIKDGKTIYDIVNNKWSFFTTLEAAIKFIDIYVEKDFSCMLCKTMLSSIPTETFFCPKCGQGYYYYDNLIVIDITDEQKKLLLSSKGITL